MRDATLGVRDTRAPLIGRDVEMAALKAALDATRRDGHARAVSLLGANGLGKTRIVDEFLREVRNAGGRVPRTYRSSARNMDHSYAPFARLLRARFGLTEGMSEEQAKAGVRAEVARVLHDRKVEDVCFFLGPLLDLDFGESPLTRAVDEQADEARVLRRAIVKSLFEGDAALGPLCLVFDDLDEADDDSRDLLRYLIAHQDGPILIVVAARPELSTRDEEWARAGGDRHRVLQLGPLDRERTTDLARALLAPCEGGVPAELVEAAIGPSGGNPGLVEQMIGVFHDVGVLGELDPQALDTRWRVDLPKLANARLPMTPEDAASARLAVLPTSARRVMEHAASAGHVFWFGLLVALARSGRAAPNLWRPNDVEDVREIEEALSDLIARDHVLELPDSVLPDEREFVFKHKLEREKVIELTAAAAAQRHHRTIANWLAQRASGRGQEELEAQVAHHLERAGAREPAGRAYLVAADLARQNYATKRAAELYARGLALLGGTDVVRSMDANHDYGDVLLSLGRTDEALAAFREMLTLAYQLRVKSKGGAAHNRIGRLHRDTGALGEARDHLDAGLELFRDARDERGVASSHDDIGKLLWLKGDYDAALEELMRGLEMRKATGDRRAIALSLNNIGLVWLDHGRPVKALEALEAALAVRREISDAFGVVQTLDSLGRLATDQNEHERALSRFTEAYERAQEIGERHRTAVVLIHLGETHYRLRDVPQAVTFLRRAEELCEELGDKLHLGEAKRALAKAWLLGGELRKARDAIKQAVDLYGQVRSRAHLAIALRTLGEVTAAGAWGEGHEVKAVDYFMRSIAICKEIGNELEVAKSYRAFSGYVRGSSHYSGNVDIQREAQKLDEMADEIFERRKIRAAT